MPGTPQIWIYDDLPKAGTVPAQYPASMQGGIDLTAAVAQGPMYIVASGSDTRIRIATGGAGYPLTGTPPAGFEPVGNLAGTFSQSTCYGSASLIDAYSISCPTAFGAAQMSGAFSAGAWYFEFTILSSTFFSDYQGAGVGLKYTGNASGLDYNFWVGDGGYHAGNPNGGGVVRSNVWPAYNAQIGALGANYSEDAFQMSAGQPYGVAFIVTPFPKTATTNPQTIQPITLPCVPCCVQTIGSGVLDMANTSGR